MVIVVLVDTISDDMPFLVKGLFYSIDFINGYSGRLVMCSGEVGIKLVLF